ELATFLLATRTGLSESSSGFERLSQRLAVLAGRLEELSQWDFQHLIRAHDFFFRTNRKDIAEALLRRAGKLAEGAAENLAMPVPRRKAAGDRAQDDDQGLECLKRAERESRDRLERLQIAREFFHYGRAGRARRILEAEGVFEPGKRLEAS